MWILFSDRQPERNAAVLVWCSKDRCAKLIDDYRSEDASNNWVAWMPLPEPPEGV